MKKLTLITLLVAATISGFGQSKPRKVTIKKSVTISKDSTYYLPDTISCVFKELIIKPDTVYEKWNKGFVVWQTWEIPTMRNLSSSIWSSGLTSSYVLSGDEVKPYKNEYVFGEVTQGKFLYQNYKPVPNRVITAYKP